MRSQTQRAFNLTKTINIVFLVVSLAICSILMLADIPGMELLETNPNWLLIWVVSWSTRRAVWQGAIAGWIVGWIYDGIVAAPPSHVASFVLLGMLTAGLQKHKYVGEDFITVAFLVFFMTVFSEAIFAWQYAREYSLSITEVARKYQQIVIISAIITSLWSPAFYYPFNLAQKKIEQSLKRAQL